jgi:hypothetical protein
VNHVAIREDVLLGDFPQCLDLRRFAKLPPKLLRFGQPIRANLCVIEIQRTDFLKRWARRRLRQVGKVSQLFDPAHGGDILWSGQKLFAKVGPDCIGVSGSGTGPGLNVCFNVRLKYGIDGVVARALGTVLSRNRNTDQFPTFCCLPLTKANNGKVFVGLSEGELFRAAGPPPSVA